MGLNISVYKLDGTREWKGKTLPNWNRDPDMDKGGWWNSIRYTGDVEFTTQVEFHSIKEYPEERDSDWVQRPKDFVAARKWVKENVYEGDQPRLLEALDKFEQDDSLYFYFGW